MRSPLVVIAAPLLFAAACGGGTRVVYVPVPAPTTTTASRPATPPPAPAPRPVVIVPPPVAVTIVRVDDGRLQVSTNQPAYLTVFEIVPNRGVTLVYPASPRQRTIAFSGANWLGVSWSSSHDIGDDRLARDEHDRNGRYDERGAQDNRERMSLRYVYAIASQRPLRLPDRAFDGEQLRAMLGARASRTTDPNVTADALSRLFVPAQTRQVEWGQDLFTVEMTRPNVATRVARVTCPDGSVVYVRDDVSQRDACPSHRGDPRSGDPRGGWSNGSARRADTAVATNGHTDVPLDPRRGPLVFRLPQAEVVQAGEPRPPQGDGRRAPAGNQGRGNGGNGGNGSANGEPTQGGDRGNGQVVAGHQDNGNHYGRDGRKDTVRSNGNAQNGDAGAKGKSSGNDNGAGNGNSNSNSNGNNGKGKGNAGKGNGTEKSPPASSGGSDSHGAAEPPKGEAKKDSIGLDPRRPRVFDPQAGADSTQSGPDKKKKQQPDVKAM